MKYSNRIVYLLAACSFIMLLSGCIKKKQQIRVQYINATINSPYADYYLQGTVRANFIGYGICSNSNTADILPGEPLIVEVKDPGTGTVLSKLSYLNWVEGTHYTVVTYGEYPNMKTALFSDTASMPPSGKFRLRFMHFSPDAPALDIYFNNILVDSNKVFYGTDSLNAIGGFAYLNAGTYGIQLKEHNSGQVLVDIPQQIGIQDNRILNVYAAGTIADTITHHISLGWAAQ
jgi:hypothetical protein